MTPWLVHELRNLGLEIVCLDARHGEPPSALINETDHIDADGRLRSLGSGVSIPSLPAAKPPLACSWVQGLNSSVVDRLSVPAVLKTFGLLPGTLR